MALDCKNLGEACFVRDNVAVAVDYGFNGNRVGTFDAHSSVVLFVDMGSVATTCTIVRYEKVWFCFGNDVQNSVEILESRSILLGGQDFSCSLCKYIKQLYLEEKSLDGLSPKLLQKMEYQFLNAADKVKCTFASGSITEASVEIEDLNSDDDFVDVELSKEDVEDVWSGKKGGENLLGQFDELVMRILQSPLLKREGLTSCEIVGCAMRLSCLREHLERCLRAASSVTISFDSRGTLLHPSQTQHNPEYGEHGSVWCGPHCPTVPERARDPPGGEGSVDVLRVGGGSCGSFLASVGYGSVRPKQGLFLRVQ